MDDDRGRGRSGPERGRARDGRAQDGSLRTVVLSAPDEAQARGSATVEAEGLLLALAAAGTDETRSILEDAGLDHDGILSALREGRRHSLAQAGIEPFDEERLAAHHEYHHEFQRKDNHLNQLRLGDRSPRARQNVRE